MLEIYDERAAKPATKTGAALEFDWETIWFHYGSSSTALLQRVRGQADLLKLLFTTPYGDHLVLLLNPRTSGSTRYVQIARCDTGQLVVECGRYGPEGYTTQVGRTPLPPPEQREVMAVSGVKRANHPGTALAFSNEGFLFRDVEPIPSIVADFLMTGLVDPSKYEFTDSYATKADTADWYI